MPEDHEYFTGQDRPQTAKKLSILRKYFAVWLTIWSGDQCSGWVGRDWRVIDLCAGTGRAQGAGGEVLSGSPLIFLEEVAGHANRLQGRGISIHITLIEQHRQRFAALESRVGEFLEAHPGLDGLVDVQCVNGDANAAVSGLGFSPLSEDPCFLLVDPFGVEIERRTVDLLVAKSWKLDVLFNYMVESIRRTHGVAIGDSSRAASNARTLEEFFGADVVLRGSGDIEDPAVYARAVFGRTGLKTVAFHMKKPGTVGTQYVLLFASRNDTVISVMRDVYAKEMTDHYGQASLFAAGDYLDDIAVIG